MTKVTWHLCNIQNRLEAVELLQCLCLQGMSQADKLSFFHWQLHRFQYNGIIYASVKYAQSRDIHSESILIVHVCVMGEVCSQTANRTTLWQISADDAPLWGKLQSQIVLSDLQDILSWPTEPCPTDLSTHSSGWRLHNAKHADSARMMGMYPWLHASLNSIKSHIHQTDRVHCGAYSGQTRSL